VTLGVKRTLLDGLGGDEWMNLVFEMSSNLMDGLTSSENFFTPIVSVC
jgi:hypothetical protein